MAMRLRFDAVHADICGWCAYMRIKFHAHYPQTEEKISLFKRHWFLNQTDFCIFYFYPMCYCGIYSPSGPLELKKEKQVRMTILDRKWGDFFTTLCGWCAMCIYADIWGWCDTWPSLIVCHSMQCNCKADDGLNTLRRSSPRWKMFISANVWTTLKMIISANVWTTIGT